MGTSVANGRCPDAEQLAALAEGAVVDDRAALVEHMRSCTACFEGYSTALALLDRNVAAGRAKSRLAWAAIAAAILVAVGIPTYLRFGGAPSARSTSAWESTRGTVSVLPRAASDPRFEPWREGDSAPYGFAPTDAARRQIRLGVRLADAEWAGRRHPAAAPAALARLRAEPVDPALPDVASGADLDRPLPGSPQAREDVALGWHLEWCRLAAQAQLSGVCPEDGDPQWSRTNEFKDPAARKAWEEVRKHLPESASPSRDWTALEASLTRLIEVLT